MAVTQHGNYLRGPDDIGLVRPRLLPDPVGVPDTRLGLVIAPPGTGKTTLLAQWASQWSTNVAWYRPSPHTDRPGRIVDRFAAALAAAVGDESPRSLADLELVAGRLEKPLVFVVDDLHTLAPTGAESELEHLLALNAPNVHFLVGSRRPPLFNLARSELPAAITVCGDALRFRAYEVDQLFRNTYKQPLSTTGTLNLTLSTDGWAAALHLFHLATKNLSPVERRRAAESPGPPSGYVRDYLTHHFLAGVSADMELLLRRCCLFDVLTPSRCDAVLDGADSRPLLVRLEQLGVISRERDGAALRVPEVLRQYFVADLGDTHHSRPDGTRERAATIMEHEGAFGAALRVSAEGHDWKKVRSLLQRAGTDAVKPGGCEWAALIPGPVLREDARCAVAAARRFLDDGCVEAACKTATEAAALASDPEWLGLARNLHRSAAVWAADAPSPVLGPAESLREAIRGNPARVARSIGDPHSPQELLVNGLSHLLAGDQRSALPKLRQCAGMLDHEPAAALAAQLALAVLGPDSSSSGPADPAAELDAVQRQAERRGFTWLARLSRGVQASLPGTSGCQDAVRAIMDSCEQRGDEWGAALISTSASLMRLRAGHPDARAFDALAVRFRGLNAGALEAWAQSALALVSATADLPEAAEEARTAEAFARAAGVPGALAIAYAAMALLRPEQHDELKQAAQETGTTAGLACRPWTWLAAAPQASALQPSGKPRLTARHARPSDAGTDVRDVEVVGCVPPPSLHVGCFGGFTLRNDHACVDLSRVRPQARTVLRILSLNAGRPVHRERIAGILWAELDTPSALHALQVSVSSLRGALQSDGSSGGQQLLVRQGEAYALVLTKGSVFDLADFDQKLHEASLARSAGDNFAAAEELRGAVQLYAGEVLPEDGPAEWVGDTRERYRLRAAEAAASLAGLELALGNPADAAAAATRSVEIDPWRDESWRTLVATFRHLGDPAAAERAQRRYDLMLNSLGVPLEHGLCGLDSPINAVQRTGSPRRIRVPPPDPSFPGF